MPDSFLLTLRPSFKAATTAVTLLVTNLTKTAAKDWIYRLPPALTASTIEKQAPDLHLHVVTSKNAPTGIPESRGLAVPPTRWQKSPNDVIVGGGHRLEFLEDRCHLTTGDDRGEHSAAALGALLNHCVFRMLAAKGVAILHGAAFQCNNSNVIVLGQSGAGKSTMAAAALAAGAQVVSDDSLLAAQSSADAITLASNRHWMSFETPTLPLLPKYISSQLDCHGTTGYEYWTLPFDRAPQAIISEISPRIAWFVSVDRRLKTSRIESISQDQALSRLVQATPSVFLSPRLMAERAGVWSVLVGLVNSCSMFRVRLGGDILLKPRETLEHLLASSSTP